MKLSNRINFSLQILTNSFRF